MRRRRLVVAITLGLLLVLAVGVALAPPATEAQTRTLTTMPELPPPPFPSPTYGDVDSTTSYQTAILAVGRYGIMIGYSDGTFRPREPILRAEFAKMICELSAARFGTQFWGTEDTPFPFTDLGPDLESSLYPHEYVGAGAAAGWILGYSDGTFRPYVDICRAQVVTMVARWARPHAHHILEPPEGFVPVMGDFDQIHGPSMGFAERAGVLRDLEGYGPTWDPWARMTRGEAAQVLWNELGRPLP